VKRKSLIFVLLMLAMALPACGSQPAATAAAPTLPPAGTVIAEGHIRPAQSVNLAFQGRGAVAAILVKTGDPVKQGDVLARLDTYDQADASLIAAQQAYGTLLRDAPAGRAQAWQAYMNAQIVRENAQKTWDGLNMHDINIHIADAQATLATRKAELDAAQANFDQYQNLDPNSGRYKDAQDRLKNKQKAYDEAVTNLETDMRLREVPRAALDAAMAAEAEAKYQYDLTATGPNADQLTLAKAQLDAAGETLNGFELKAPFDGIVADVSVDPGQQVGPETIAVSLVNPGQWIVETDDLTELEVVKLAMGQKVSIVPDALPDVKLTGTVQSISAAFTKQGGDIVYAVRILVDNPVDPRIRWGMTVEATFVPLK
jgi:HlyD family secretion protein